MVLKLTCKTHDVLDFLIKGYVDASHDTSIMMICSSATVHVKALNS